MARITLSEKTKKSRVLVVPRHKAQALKEKEIVRVQALKRTYAHSDTTPSARDSEDGGPNAMAYAISNASEWNSMLITARAERGPQWDVGIQQFLVDHGSDLYYNPTPLLEATQKERDEVLEPPVEAVQERRREQPMGYPPPQMSIQHQMPPQMMAPPPPHPGSHGMPHSVDMSQRHHPPPQNPHGPPNGYGFAGAPQMRHMGGMPFGGGMPGGPGGPGPRGIPPAQFYGTPPGGMNMGMGGMNMGGGMMPNMGGMGGMGMRGNEGYM